MNHHQGNSFTVENFLQHRLYLVYKSSGTLFAQYRIYDFKNTRLLVNYIVLGLLEDLNFLAMV